MDANKLHNAIRQKKSFLCVGLDSDLAKIPEHLLSLYDPVFEFNKKIVEATSEYAVAYKLNAAFYESRGPEGWRSLERTLEIIPEGCLKIADAKRGDVGHSAEQYARTFFETYKFDAVTVNPYMGRDAVEPFLDYFEKWVFLLLLTSNEGAEDFQMKDVGGRPLYEEVIAVSKTWKKKGIMGYVVGATREAELTRIRSLVPDDVLLVPGVGEQGGSLENTLEKGVSGRGNLLINASRSILYVGTEKDYDSKAEIAAEDMADRMKPYVPST